MAAVQFPPAVADFKQPVASTSAAVMSNGVALATAGASNPKAKAVFAPTYVNLPNSAPRSYTVLKEVGDGSFGTVWLADWHSQLECVDLYHSKPGQQTNLVTRSLPPGTAPPGPSSRPEYSGKKLVAIKRMKKSFTGGWDECMELKELKVSLVESRAFPG